jgi:hypothetical protein
MKLTVGLRLFVQLRSQIMAAGPAVLLAPGDDAAIGFRIEIREAESHSA